jgi:hypothetical protein
MSTTTKNVFDTKHVKSVSAIALYKDGKQAGKIVCNWSDNPAGSVCTAQVCLWEGEVSSKVKKRRIKTEFLDTEIPEVMIGKAGGCGYDKRSAAISSALDKGGIRKYLPVEGGSGNERDVFEKAGFDWFEVC